MHIFCTSAGWLGPGNVGDKCDLPTFCWDHTRDLPADRAVSGAQNYHFCVYVPFFILAESLFSRAVRFEFSVQRFFCVSAAFKALFPALNRSLYCLCASFRFEFELATGAAFGTINKGKIKAEVTALPYVCSLASADTTSLCFTSRIPSLLLVWRRSSFGNHVCDVSAELLTI
jgi:hypothetical protein